MTGGAIASLVFIWLLYLGVLGWSISRMRKGKGGAWED